MHQTAEQLIAVYLGLLTSNKLKSAHKLTLIHAITGGCGAFIDGAITALHPSTFDLVTGTVGAWLNSTQTNHEPIHDGENVQSGRADKVAHGSY